MKLLHIETATSVCSVCISINGELKSIRESHTEKIHATAITVFIEEVLKDVGIHFLEIDAIAVSKGPGSYTGLRIGVSTAKGLCYALNKPLIGISTLQAMAKGFSPLPRTLSQGEGRKELICPMLDARRMEVYSAFYDTKNNLVRKIQADIIDEYSYAEILQNHPVYFIGSGVAKCKSLLSKYENAFFDETFSPSSSYLISLAEKAFTERQFEDVAYFEPYYLKDFVTTAPKNKF